MRKLKRKQSTMENPLVALSPKLITPILNESIHWDTLLTRPVQYLKRKQIKLYHYSDRKLDKIVPVGMNAGNRFAGPRISSWWTEHEDEWTLPIQIYLKCKYREYFGTELYWDAKALHANKNADGTLSVGMLITKDFYEKHKADIDKLVVYRHEKTFDIRDVGRGTEPTVPEWTTELEVVPDKVTKLTIKGLFEHKAINFATREEIIEAKEYRDMLSKKYNTPYVFPYLSNYKVEWWKYDGNTYKLKRKQAEEKNNIDSYKEIHMKAIKEDLELNESFFSHKNIELNPKYADKFISPDELKVQLKKKLKGKS